ncbi:MAG: hypothetical protein ACREJD_14495 [Phycisphaerales bacterium]
MQNSLHYLVRTTMFVGLALIALLLTGCQSGLLVRAEDLDRLTGPEWKGTLTTRDNLTNKETTIESTLTVVKVAGLAEVGNDFSDAGVRSSWEFQFAFPQEPKENYTETFMISFDGKRLGDENVRERIEVNPGSPPGTLVLITEKTGSDNDKPANLRFRYTLSDQLFMITKYVKPEGTADFFQRSEYRWTR